MPMFALLLSYFMSVACGYCDFDRFINSSSKSFNYAVLYNVLSSRLHISNAAAKIELGNVSSIVTLNLKNPLVTLHVPFLKAILC